MAGKRSRAQGELEREILAILRANELPLSGKEILEVFPGSKPAHTTLLTTLDRLRLKGDVERVGTAARNMRFKATRTDSEHTGKAMLDSLTESSDRRASLLKFAGSLDPGDIEVLRDALKPKAPKAPRGE